MPILMPMTVHFPFQNTYAALPANFFARVAPTPVAAPRLIKLNRPLAKHLGLDPDWLASPEGAEILAGKLVPGGGGSHTGVGPSKFLAARGDPEGGGRWAARATARHYPEVADRERPYLALLSAIIARQADLVARWLLVGFIHGVMNTDNTS